jgi:ribosomal-protein-alanine N-acetyltransferase
MRGCVACCDRSSIEAIPSFTILTARLRLRPLGPEDVDSLSSVYLHPFVARWIGPHTREDVAREIEQQVDHQKSLGWSCWGVEERDTGSLIGDCGLQPLEHRGPEVELGYDFHPRVWGHGFATEAARSVMRQAFGTLGIERVVAVVKPDNIASRRVLETAGLRPSGTREAYGESLLLYEARREPRTARA